MVSQKSIPLPFGCFCLVLSHCNKYIHEAIFTLRFSYRKTHRITGSSQRNLHEGAMSWHLNTAMESWGSRLVYMTLVLLLGGLLGPSVICRPTQSILLAGSYDGHESHLECIEANDITVRIVKNSPVPVKSGLEEEYSATLPPSLILSLSRAPPDTALPPFSVLQFSLFFLLHWGCLNPRRV